LEQTELSPRVGPGAVDSVIAVGPDGWGVEDIVVDFVAEFCRETQEQGCLLVAFSAREFLVLVGMPLRE